MQFTAHGHKNILATHKTTIEFTKDKDLTKDGNCIVGVSANFNLEEIKPLLKSDRIKITIKAGDSKEEIIAKPNKDFNSEKEMVIRFGDFLSNRTLATSADKSAKYLDRRLIEKLKNPKQKIVVVIEQIL